MLNSFFYQWYYNTHNTTLALSEVYTMYAFKKVYPENLVTNHYYKMCPGYNYTTTSHE